MDWLKFLRTPVDIQSLLRSLLQRLRIGFLVLYWVIWVGLRGVNVFIIIRMMEGYSFVGFGWFYIAHILFIMPLYVLFNLFFIVFKHLQTFITIHVSNHFILSIILLIVVDHYAVYIYTLLFLFDLLILLFFLRSKRYGFFRERDTDS